MIRAVFLDLYNTVCRFEPSREERQRRACAEFGLEVSLPDLERAYLVGEEYWTVENAHRSVARRPDDERLAFYSEYERYLLEQAGLEVPLDVARQIYQRYLSYPRGLRLYDDVLPVVAQLKAQGLKLGLISNNDRPVEPICEELGLMPYLDVQLSSWVVGHEKPDRRIFEAALQAAGAAGREAVHVGDQYYSDVVGARAAGIVPVLIDRTGLAPVRDECVRISCLWPLPDLLCTLG